MPRARRSTAWILACLAAALGSPSLADGAIGAVRVSLDAGTALAYYLQCASGRLRSCSRDEATALLAEIYGPERAHRAIEDWVGRTQAASAASSSPAPPGMEWPDVGPVGAAEDPLARARGVLHAGDALWPAFAVWWSRHEAAWQDYASRLRAIVESDAEPAIRSARRQFAQDSGDALAISLVPLPNEGPVRRAFQQGSQGYIEFKPDEDPGSRAAVAVHEYVHYLFHRAPESLHRARWNSYCASAEPGAASALAVFNEAIAAAIGNGMFMRAHLDVSRFDAYSAREGSFYAAPAVDRVAKAILPLVEESARAGAPLDRSFFDAYFDIAGAVFEGNPADPRVALGVSQVYYTQDSLEERAWEAGGRYGWTSYYTNRWSRETFGETIGSHFPALAVAILATEDDYREPLQALVPGADLPVQDGTRGRACKAKRAGGGWVFVFAMDLASDRLELPDALQDCPLDAS